MQTDLAAAPLAPGKEALDASPVPLGRIDRSGHLDARCLHLDALVLHQDVMRTTIRIDEHLLKEAKRLAAATGRTLNDVVEDAVRESLARRKESRARQRVELPVFRGGGLQPGVDLDDGAALLDIMGGGH